MSNPVVFHPFTFRTTIRTMIRTTIRTRLLIPQSVCYQLPALLTPQSVTLVVSPLLSLIHDQVGALRDLGVRVEALTGVADKDEANRVLRALDSVDNPVNLLYGRLNRVCSAGGGVGDSHVIEFNTAQCVLKGCGYCTGTTVWHCLALCSIGSIDSIDCTHS